MLPAGLQPKRTGSLQERLLGFLFLASFGARATVSLFAASNLIRVVEEHSVTFYFSVAAGITFLISLLIFLGADRFKPSSRFIGLHTSSLVIALIAYLSPDATFRASLVFFAILGSRTTNTYSNWSLAHVYIDSARSKSVFARLGTATQVGGVLGAMLVFGLASQDVDDRVFLLIWALAEAAILVAVAMLLCSGPTLSEAHSRSGYILGSIGPYWKSIKRYRIVPWMGAWNLVWGFIFARLAAMILADLGGMGHTVLHYGTMGVMIGVSAILVTRFVYPLVLKKWPLGSTFLFLSLTLCLAVVVNGTFLTKASLTMLFVVINLIQVLMGVILSTILSLYPSCERDRLRISLDTLSFALGGQLSGVLDGPISLYLALIVLALIAIGVSSSYGMDMIYFLRYGTKETRRNAIDLFDRFGDTMALKAFGVLSSEDDVSSEGTGRRGERAVKSRKARST